MTITTVRLVVSPVTLRRKSLQHIVGMYIGAGSAKSYRINAKRSQTHSFTHPSPLFDPFQLTAVLDPSAYHQLPDCSVPRLMAVSGRLLWVEVGE